MEKKIFFFYILGYGDEAKRTTLETALFYKDHPEQCRDNKYPKVVLESDQKTIRTQPSELQKIHGYKLRKDHVKKSQEVPFCTNLHIDFLQSAK